MDLEHCWTAHLSHWFAYLNVKYGWDPNLTVRSFICFPFSHLSLPLYSQRETRRQLSVKSELQTFRSVIAAVMCTHAGAAIVLENGAEAKIYRHNNKLNSIKQYLWMPFCSSDEERTGCFMVNTCCVVQSYCGKHLLRSIDQQYIFLPAPSPQIVSFLFSRILKYLLLRFIASPTIH